MDARGYHHGNSQNRTGCVPINDSTSTGFFKGLILLPFVFVVHVASVIFFNVLSFFIWIDHGFATVRFTRLFGPILKCFIFVLVPFIAILYFVLSIVAVIIASPFFALINPGYVTLQLKMQTAWRNAYFWAGWSETLGDTIRHARQYYYFVTVGSKEAMRTIRRKAWPKQYELYPVRLCLSIMTFIFGLVVGATFDLLIYLLKGPFILVRAFKNHIDDAHLWFRKSNIVTGLIYFPWFLLIVLGYFLLIPYVLFWALRSAFEAAGLAYSKLTGFINGIDHVYHSIRTVYDETSRYIMRQSVPYEKKRITTPFSPIWALAAALPILCGLVVVPFINFFILVSNYFSVVRVGVEKCVGQLQYKREALSGPKIVGLYALICLSPLIALFWLLYHFIKTVLQTGYSGYVVHRKRSIRLGFHHMCAICYMFEYHINKFTVATSPEEQVHWVSVLPNLWAYWSMPYMDPLEFADTGAPADEVAYVEKPPRYIPPGLRRPRIDESTGEIIDMSGPAYDIPSIGITRVGLGGSLTPPLHHVQVGPPNQRGFYATANSIVTIFKYLFSSDDATTTYSSTFIPTHTHNRYVRVLRAKDKQSVPSNNPNKKVAEPLKSESLLSRLTYFRSANLKNRLSGSTGNARAERTQPPPLEVTYGVELLPAAYRMAILKAQSESSSNANAEWINSSQLVHQSTDAIVDGNISYPKFASIVADAVKTKALEDRLYGGALAHNRKQQGSGSVSASVASQTAEGSLSLVPATQSSDETGTSGAGVSESKAEEPQLVPKLRDVAKVDTDTTKVWFFCCSSFAFDGYEDDNAPKEEAKPQVTGKTHFDTRFDINKTTTLVSASPQSDIARDTGSAVFHSNAMLGDQTGVPGSSPQKPSSRPINTGELPVGIRGEKLFTLDAVQGALADQEARDKARTAELKESKLLRQKQRERTERELRAYKFWEGKSLAQHKSKSAQPPSSAAAPDPASMAPPVKANDTRPVESRPVESRPVREHVVEDDPSNETMRSASYPEPVQNPSSLSLQVEPAQAWSSPVGERLGNTSTPRRNSISRSVAGLDDAMQRLRSPGALSATGDMDSYTERHHTVVSASSGGSIPGDMGRVQNEDDLSDSDSEEEFVLAPIVRPDLPDTWIELPTGDGDVYYVNYARNQSNWTRPDDI